MERKGEIPKYTGTLTSCGQFKQILYESLVYLTRDNLITAYTYCNINANFNVTTLQKKSDWIHITKK